MHECLCRGRHSVHRVVCVCVCAACGVLQCTHVRCVVHLWCWEAIVVSRCVCVPITKVSVSDRGVICQSVRGDRGGDRELDPAGQIKHAYMTI